MKLEIRKRKLVLGIGVALPLVYIGLTGCRLLSGLLGDGGNPDARPPEQPASGPGSSDYQHASVTQGEFGADGTKFFLYEPADPAPSSAPVIVFLHGYGAINPRAYGAWISHLVRKGNNVVFPVYQTTLRDAETYTDNALSAVLNAYDVLGSDGHVPPDEAAFALVGHSLGGIIAANIATRATDAGLPGPRAVLGVNVGDSNSIIQSLDSILENLSGIPEDALVLTVVGEDDNIAGDTSARRILDRLNHLPAQNRELLRLFSDDYGEPDLVANHSAPLALDEAFDSGEALLSGTEDRTDTAQPNALDFYGYWKFLDGLTDFAFFGMNRDFALGNTEEQTFMGEWSDGTPVKPARGSTE